jgi:hypothetical protein
MASITQKISEKPLLWEKLNRKKGERKIKNERKITEAFEGRKE